MSNVDISHRLTGTAIFARCQDPNRYQFITMNGNMKLVQMLWWCLKDEIDPGWNMRKIKFFYLDKYCTLIDDHVLAEYVSFYFKSIR